MTSTQTVLSEHCWEIKIATNPINMIQQTTSLPITDWHMDGKIKVTQLRASESSVYRSVMQVSICPKVIVLELD